MLLAPLGKANHKLNKYYPAKAMANFKLLKTNLMKDLLRALLAGWGAKKLGFGCFGTVIAFFVIYYLLKHVF